jgi:hypothetical protein
MCMSGSLEIDAASLFKGRSNLGSDAAERSVVARLKRVDSGQFAIIGSRPSYDGDEQPREFL